MSGTVLYLVTYAAVVAFFVVVIAKWLRISRMPMHVRWELYPVAHEGGDKPKYGGSKMEEVDWWTKPEFKSVSNEMKAMIPEMIFLEALFKHNRQLWLRSFPFHFGLYLLAGAFGLLVLGGLMQIGGMSFADGFGGLVGSVTKFMFWIGMPLATLGTLGLLQRRLFDEDLKDYTLGADIFNLVFFAVVLGLTWATFLTVGAPFDVVRGFVANLVTFNLSAPVGNGLVWINVLLFVGLVAYIPMTHMSHFFLKWFTWHKIRWDDEANKVGSDIEKKVLEQVNYPVTWSAPHLKADGKKTWVDIATEEMD